MRIPRVRVRLTVRRLMLAVAIVAVLLGTLRRQSARDYERAEAYAALTFHSGSLVFVDGRKVERDPIARARDPWAWAMAERYWRLSDYPWLIRGPDPPPPPEALADLDGEGRPPRDPALRIWSFRKTSPPRWTFLWTWRP